MGSGDGIAVVGSTSTEYKVFQRLNAWISQFLPRGTARELSAVSVLSEVFDCCICIDRVKPGQKSRRLTWDLKSAPSEAMIGEEVELTIKTVFPDALWGLQKSSITADERNRQIQISVHAARGRGMGAQVLTGFEKSMKIVINRPGQWEIRINDQLKGNVDIHE